MNKSIIPAIALTLASAKMSAQSLYMSVFDKAQAVINNPTADKQDQLVSQFKVDALVFMSLQGSKQETAKDNEYYDSQAVNLNSFLENYFRHIEAAKKLSPQAVESIRNCYASAAQDNPMFPGLEPTMGNAYVITTDSPTPFPLNTNWELAYDDATRKARKILKR